MTFDDLWPTLVIPGEFDGMDQCDQQRWRAVLQQAFDAGRDATSHAEILRLRAALEVVARHFSSDWPERCQSNVLTARKALGA